MKFSIERNSSIQGIGLALSLTGYMYAWTIGSKLGATSYVAISVALLTGILLIGLGARDIFGRILSSFRGLYAFPVTCFVLIAFMSLFGSQKDFAWAAFGMLFLCATRLLQIRDPDSACRAFAYTATAGVVLYLASTSDMVVAANRYGELSRVATSDDNAGYTLIAYAAAAGLIGNFYLLTIGVGRRLISVLSVPICLTAILMAGTRSVYLGIVLAVSSIIFLYGRKSKGGYYGIFVLAVIICIISVTGLMSDRITHMLDFISRGLFTILGDKSSLGDPSALSRINQRSLAIDLFLNNPVFGAGFKHYWVDFPLLQSFSDGGFFFGTLYLLAILVIPLWYCWSLRGSSSSIVILMLAIYILNLPRLFLHGEPYDWTVCTYALLPYAAGYLGDPIMTSERV
jgi:hypothetical protein